MTAGKRAVEGHTTQELDHKGAQVRQGPIEVYAVEALSRGVKAERGQPEVSLDEKGRTADSGVEHIGGAPLRPCR